MMWNGVTFIALDSVVLGAMQQEQGFSAPLLSKKNSGVVLNAFVSLTCETNGIPLLLYITPGLRGELIIGNHTQCVNCRFTLLITERRDPASTMNSILDITPKPSPMRFT